MYQLSRHVDNCADIRLSARLTIEDLRRIQADIDRLVREHETIRLMLRIDEFVGWGMDAVPDDLRLDIKFGKKVELIAVVGREPWHRQVTDVMTNLIRSNVEFFDTRCAQQAWYWLMAS